MEKKNYSFKPEALDILPVLKKDEFIDFVPYVIEGYKEIKTGKNKGKFKYRAKIKIVNSNLNIVEGKKFRWFASYGLSIQLADNPNFLRTKNTYRLTKLDYGFVLKDLCLHHIITTVKRRKMITPTHIKSDAQKQTIIQMEAALNNIHKPNFRCTEKAIKRYNELLKIMNDIGASNDTYAVLCKDDDALTESCEALSLIFEIQSKLKNKKIEVMSHQTYLKLNEKDKLKWSRNKAEVELIIRGFMCMLSYGRKFRPESPIAQARFVKTNCRLLFSNGITPINKAYLDYLSQKILKLKGEIK